MTPVGLFLPATEALFIDHVTSKVTSDCRVERREPCWEAVRDRCSPGAAWETDLVARALADLDHAA